MKKTYIIPSIEVVKLHTCELLTVSSLGLDNNSSNQLDTGEILSREADFFDDEEDF